jgi:hypothetical protein
LRWAVCSFSNACLNWIRTKSCALAPSSEAESLRARGKVDLLLKDGPSSESLPYQRPSYSNDARLFSDLLCVVPHGVSDKGGKPRPARQLECREKALDAEFADPPAVLNLQTVRAEYGQLLGHYRQLSQALVTLRLPAPTGFRRKVVRAADRWRALGRNNATACNRAARILQALGERDLAWDYRFGGVNRRGLFAPAF